MSISLRNQTVYAPAVTGVKPVTVLILASACLLMVLTGKIWVKASLVDIGYSLAVEKKNGETLSKEKQELELLKNLMLQQDNLSVMAEQAGLVNLKAEQIINLK